jgi:hypothetical protein
MSLLSRLAVQAARAYGILSSRNTNVPADFLVVAGGGAGGYGGNAYFKSGGGGAGGFRTSAGTSGGGASAETALTLSTLNTYTITVGAGGTISSSTGTNGNNSSISGTGITTVTSIGGGVAGGGQGNSSNYGVNGGSGGGAMASSYASDTTWVGGAGTANQGYAGGTAYFTSNTTITLNSGAGGGGAGAVGSNGVPTNTTGAGGNGGAGVASSISGSSVTYAGGGGGGGYSTGGTGGSGGGGNGGGGTVGSAGTANRGGGGGGSAGATTAVTNTGGSGIVIISYTSATPKFVGGTLTTSGGNQIHTFTSSGTLSPLTPITASYLVVAGGGGGAGASNGGGAGGAGGLLTSSTTIYSGATYVVTVGAGGTGGTSGTNGSDSVLSGTGITTVTSVGGGRANNNANGSSGGSGGGASSTNGTVYTGGAGTSGQGFAGGNSVSTDPFATGGGGGASAVGANGSGSQSGNGGAGTASSISGTSVTYAGGGGGGATSQGSARGTGGAGGGGNGGASGSSGASGTPNLGGGGGGGSNSGGVVGGAGGSGVVIISYAGSQAFNGGLVTSSGGNTIHTFTSTGALTPLTNNLTNSLRFRRSADPSLIRTPASATNRKTWTWSGWVKRGLLGTDYARLFAASDGSGNNEAVISFQGANTLIVYSYIGAYQLQLITTQVFRDPSAWYHIVVAFDTTQATAANRCKVYVNGNQVTAFSTATYPSQNYDGYINIVEQHAIGYDRATGERFDGYFADINFIDGQALEPYYFGNNDANNVWKPILYKGTYGTNGFYLKFNQGLSNSYAASFNGSTQYLTVADNAALELGSSDFCVEAWVNYTSLTGFNYLLGKVADATSATAAWLIYKNSNSGVMGFYASSNGSSYDMFSAATIGTLTAGTWNHIAVYRSGNTFYGALNGVVTVLGTSSSTIFNNTSAVGIGAAANGGAKLASSISNFRIVTGSAIYGGANFTPPTSALTAITGTQLLTLQSATIIDNSTNAFTITNNGTTTTTVSYPYSTVGIGADSSPNFNNWTSNNISLTAGTTYDAMLDVPTNTSATVANYAVWNPLAGSVGVTLSQANLSATFDSASGTRYGTIGTIGVSSGKWYWEYEFSAGGNSALLGITQKPFAVQMGTWPGEQTGDYGYYGSNGNKYTAGSGSAYGATFTTGDIIGVALDLDAGTLTFYKNNTSQGTAYSSISGTFFPAIGKGITATGITSFVNFGQRPFSYTPPTGFVALNTFNLPTPTILQGNKYMDATTYVATGTAPQTVTNAAQFKPDLVWTKNRTSAGNHYLNDSVRGAANALNSNTTSAEASLPNYITSFNSNGYGIGSDNFTSGQNIVGWQWQAGQSSGSSNTSGSITSTVSVNTTAGFSVVTYTGTGSNATVGHGLGAEPSMIIIKARAGADASTRSWAIYRKDLGNTSVIWLDLTAVVNTSRPLYWNSTSPTSSVFSIGTDTDVNRSSQTYVAYCWAEIAGFSKFGSYTGNGSTDGPFVYTGFLPKYILIKRTDTIASWVVMDTSRGLYNASYYYLLPNLSDADSGPIAMDFLSNGFKLRLTSAAWNASGGTYIYAAYAENPFKNSNAR